MDAKKFWQQKIVQFFHDPPAKPYTSWPGSGGHRKVAADLYERFSGLELRFALAPADHASAGADRPMIAATRKKGVSPVSVYWPKSPIITHPLSAGCRLDLRREGQQEPHSRCELREELIRDQEIEAEELSETFGDWGSAEHLGRSFVRLWRRFRDELVFEPTGPTNKQARLGFDLLWAEMPAETRCPDHSIWDHLRVTTALAFMTRKRIQDPEHPQAPWLLRFSLGPVQGFIQESRTTRDLWTSSFLLSDLAWHAMRPLVEAYGPDCIVYPDLRGNPHVDAWLHEKNREALPAFVRNPSSFAALLPNAFVALVPRGGAGHLERVEHLAEMARQSLQNRWNKLSEMVRDWLAGEIPNAESAIQQSWDRQHAGVFYTTWSAVPWLPMEPITNVESLRGRALSAQPSDFRQPPSPQDKAAVQARRERLAPWVPKEVWTHYELAREVYARTNLNWHQMERGFDYALTHHQLSERHALRKLTSPQTLSQNREPGEKCTLCGKRTALGGHLEGRRIESARQAARTFWGHKTLDPSETGSDRLCTVCAVKRFLVPAGLKAGTLVGINQLWAGPATPLQDILDDDGKVRVPFPSAATLAAQEFLASIVRDRGLRPYLDRVNQAHRKAGLPRTSFPRALPRLAAAYREADPIGKDFLNREAQETIFPEAVEGMRRFWEGKDPEKARALEGLHEKVLELLIAAKDSGCHAPQTRLAAIRLDGDRMGRLLLGAREAIGACWKDVLHPQVLEKMEHQAQLREAGWPVLLEQSRLMGPSLQAFVSRALAAFSHRIVPWVVEQEFSGRLIYCGGDDVLCLAPAADALGIAARLQQLFSAPWVIDNDYRIDAWDWRRTDFDAEFDSPHARFQVPSMTGQNQPVRLPISIPEGFERHCADPEVRRWMRNDAVVLPMLGKQCSLSAGIAYGHYKTPLRRLLQQSGRLIDELAKEKAGRRAAGLSHMSRNGVKTEFAIGWEDQGMVQSVTRAFENGALSMRLPYKLRELTPLVVAALECLQEGERKEAGELRERLLNGLFANALDGKKNIPAEDHAFQLWKAGIELWEGQIAVDGLSRAADGLLLCRYLTGKEGGE